MNNETSDEEIYSEEQPEKRRSRRDRKSSIEEQVQKVAKDDMERAREIVMIRKELIRLNYKVKTYHNQARLANGIIQLIIIGLLIAVLYHEYAA